MKLVPITKIDKRNKTTSKKFDDVVMWENCDVITIFSFTVNLAECRVCNTYIFMNSNFSSYKN